MRAQYLEQLHLGWNSTLHTPHDMHMQIRQSAGLLLKNNLKQQYAASPPNYQEYIKVGPCRLLPWPFGIVL